MMRIDLKTVIDILQSITLDGETGETGETAVIAQAISRESPVSPLSHQASLVGETQQVFDMLGVHGPASPVLPVSSDWRVAQTSPAPFFAGGRRPAPCLHQRLQEGRRATCAGCGLTVPVLP